MKLRRKLLILPPVALGVVVFAAVVRQREEPRPVELSERAAPVRVATVAKRSVVPRAVAYGSVQPARAWRASAEMAGRVISVHPRLDVGELLPEGTELFRLDPTEFELRVARLEADSRSAEAELLKLGVGEENTAASLEVARESLALAERELDRLKELSVSGAVSRSSIDAQKGAVLREKAVVVDLESALRTADADEELLKARQQSTEAQLAETRLELSRTVFLAPFDLRISAVHVEASQAVSMGAVLVEADGIDVAEVQVELSGDQVARLLAGRTEGTAPSPEKIWETLGLNAQVHLRGGGADYRWPAEFSRVAGFLDAKTRSLSLVVSVLDPYRSAAESGRPPLAKGMFVEVELWGQPLEDRAVIPLAALHGENAFLADASNRLIVSPIQIEFVQRGEAIVASGLEGGEQLVISDLIPALPGMLLEPSAEAP